MGQSDVEQLPNIGRQISTVPNDIWYSRATKQHTKASRCMPPHKIGSEASVFDSVIAT